MKHKAKVGLWFDKQGKPLTDYDQIENLLRDREYVRVARTEVGDYHVSTIWLGLNQSPAFLHDPLPTIFETMIFETAISVSEPLKFGGQIVREGGREYHKSFDYPKEAHDSMRRYCTLEEARSGHEEMVTELTQWLEANK